MLENDSSSQGSVANMAGISQNTSFCFTSRCFSAGLDTTSWVVDTGGTNNMVYSMESLLNSSSAPPYNNQVHLPNGQTTEVKHQ